MEFKEYLYNKIHTLDEAMLQKEEFVILWAIARNICIENILHALLSLEEPFGKCKRKNFNMRIKNLLFGEKKLRKPILFLTSSRFNTYSNKYGCYWNSFSDYFVNLMPNHTNILEMYHPSFNRGKRCFKVNYMESFKLDILKFLRNKGLLYIPLNLKTQFYNFVTYLRKILLEIFETKLQSDVVIKKCVNRLHHALVDFYYLEKPFKNFIKAFEPNIVILFAGYGGGINSVYVKWLHEMGIFSADFQHGVISPIHPGYFFINDIKYPRIFLEFYPDFLLTWGDFWFKNANVIGEKIIIGNPHLMSQAEELSQKNKEVIAKRLSINKEILKDMLNKKIILFVSQGIITSEFVKIAIEISKKIPPGYFIVYKLHPEEISFVDRYNKLFDYKNIYVAKHGDILEWIYISEYIVGFTSTSLYESLLFDKNILVFEKDPLTNLYIDVSIGLRFKNSEELLEKILESPYKGFKNNGLEIEHLFHPNWEKNYFNFIQSILNNRLHYN